MHMHTTPAGEQLTKLAEALFRFSAGIDPALALHVRAVAVRLAGAVAASDEKEIAGTLASARGILALGERLGMIDAADARVIDGAISRSRELALPAPAPVPSVADFASIAPAGDATRHAVAEVDVSVSRPFPATQIAATGRPASIALPATPAGAALPGIKASLSAADRQQRITDTIRQNPEARMRDLLAALPGVSERTLRYDLERLAASGKIEREGMGGPATRYRLRAGVTSGRPATL